MYNEDDLYNEGGSSNKGFWLKILVILLFIGGLGYLLFRYFTTNLEIDRKTNCALDEQGHIITNGKTTFLIDLTDPLSKLQKDYIVNSVSQEITNLPYGNLITIYFLDAESNKETPPFLQKCKLKNVADASGAIEDKTQLELQNKNFNKEVKKLIENRMEIQEAENSPILDILQAVALNPYFKYQFSDSQHNKYYKAIGAHEEKAKLRLLIYSDMLHYTKSFSMYSKNYSFESYRKNNISLEKKATFTDVNVELHYLVNRSEFQTLRNTKFWEDYFFNAGGRLVSTRVVGK